MTSRYRDILNLKNRCKFYLDYIDKVGNECAYSDSIVAEIKRIAKLIVEFGDETLNENSNLEYKIVRRFYNYDTQGSAIIEEVKIRPYHEVEKTIKSYRLVVKDEDDFVYYVSCHEHLGDAEAQLLDHCGYKICKFREEYLD